MTPETVAGSWLTPKLSVIVPTRGDRPSLRSTVISLLSQRPEDLEVIVVVDGDGARISDYLAGITDPRLRVLTQARAGVSAARNAGLKAARHEWVAFVDDDDVPRPEWLATWQEALGPSIAAATACLGVWCDGRLQSTRMVQLLPDDPTMSASTLMAGAFVVRRDLLVDIGGYDPALRASENQDLGLRLIDRIHDIDGTVAHVDRVVIDVHVEAAENRRERQGGHFGDAAQLLLARYPDRIAADPGAFDAFHRIISSAKRQQGEWRGATRHAVLAVRRRPTRWDNYRVLILSFTPMRLERFWSARSRRGRRRRRSGPASLLEQPFRPNSDAPRIWGVLVTYQRPSILASTLSSLRAQTRVIDELVVVDNGSEDAVRRIADDTGAHYLAGHGNIGPAGGIALGMRFVLERATAGDWCLLIDDDDPPSRDSAVEELFGFAKDMLALDEFAAGVGLVGGRYSRRSGQMVRVDDDELRGPVRVDYIGGNHLPLYRCDVLARIGVFDSRLFFGFEECEFGLRLGRHGYRLYVDGDPWRRDREAKGRMNLTPADLRTALDTAAWRRYYSLRNAVVLARRHGGAVAPFVVATGGLYRAIPPLVKAKRPIAEILLPVRGAWHGFTGRLGAVVDPGAAEKRYALPYDAKR